MAGKIYDPEGFEIKKALVECKECKYKEVCGAKVLIREANRFNLKEITYCSYGGRNEGCSLL